LRNLGVGSTIIVGKLSGRERQGQGARAICRRYRRYFLFTFLPAGLILLRALPIRCPAEENDQPAPLGLRISLERSLCRITLRAPARQPGSRRSNGGRGCGTHAACSFPVTPTSAAKRPSGPAPRWTFRAAGFASRRTGRSSYGRL